MTAQTGSPELHVIAPVLHGSTGAQEASAVQLIQVPVGSQT